MSHINRKKLAVRSRADEEAVSLRSLCPTARDIAKGARVGFYFALGYCLIAVLIYAAEGSRPFQRNDTSLGVMLVLYLFGFTVAGLIVGVFHRVASRYTVLAYMIGIVAAVPMSFATTAVVRQHFVGWETNDWLTALTGSVIFGILGTRTFRKDPVQWD